MEAQKLIKHITTDCVKGSYCAQCRTNVGDSDRVMLKLFTAATLLRRDHSFGEPAVLFNLVRKKQIRQVFGENKNGIWDHSSPQKSLNLYELLIGLETRTQKNDKSIFNQGPCLFLLMRENVSLLLRGCQPLCFESSLISILANDKRENLFDHASYEL